MERMSLRTQRQVKAPITPKAFFVPSRNVLLQGKCACGGKSRAGGECEECRNKRLQAQTSDTPSAIKNESHPPNMHEVIRSPDQPLDTESRSSREPQFGHDFGKLRVHSDAKAADSAISVAGQFPPGPQPEPPTSDTKPIPMDNPSPAGPAITVSNGWANPAGKQDRTTVGIGELNSFVVNDVAGGSWKSADGTGTTVNSVTFRWTASAAGNNVITYTAADGSTSSVTMKTEVPSTLSGKKDSDLTFPTGTQGAGMELTVTVSPKTVSFQALELMEGTCDPSATSGYFTSHTPGKHDAAAGAGNWRQVGPDNDVSDTADSSGWSSPWSKGSYTWSIPVSWRLKGAKTSTAFSANNDQVITITGTDGTTIVTKLGAKTAPRKP
jgi:hypothetical protein